MSEVKLSGKKRTESGKNNAGRLRRSGMIPANLISGGAAQGISVPAADFRKILKNGLRQSTIFNLEVEDGDAKNAVYVKELQRDPVTGDVLHVDFYKVQPGVKVTVNVGIESVGVSKGVRSGGALEHYIRSLKVKAAPESLRDLIEVDITDMDVDAAVHLQELGLPEDWEVMMEGNPIILKIARSRLTRDEDDEQVTEEVEAAPAES